VGKGREVNCDGVTGEVIVKRNVGSVIVTKDAGIDGDSDSGGLGVFAVGEVSMSRGGVPEGVIIPR
jgi:hypothetical protein